MLQTTLRSEQPPEAKFNGHKSFKSGDIIYQYVTWRSMDGYVTLRFGVSHKPSALGHI